MCRVELSLLFFLFHLSFLFACCFLFACVLLPHYVVNKDEYKFIVIVTEVSERVSRQNYSIDKSLRQYVRHKSSPQEFFAFFGNGSEFKCEILHTHLVIMYVYIGIDSI